MSEPKRVPLEPLGDLVIARRNLDEATEIADLPTLLEAVLTPSLHEVVADYPAAERSLALALAARLVRRIEYLDGLRTSSEPLGLHEQDPYGEDVFAAVRL